MDIWEEMVRRAAAEYHPEELSPFIYAHHVVCALQAEDGRIFTGFCIESCSGVMNLCAERAAAVNMLLNGGGTHILRMVAFRDAPPEGLGGMPCGACREFFMQLDRRNAETEILKSYAARETVRLGELIPEWWGVERYEAAEAGK